MRLVVQSMPKDILKGELQGLCHIPTITCKDIKRHSDGPGGGFSPGTLT